MSRLGPLPAVALVTAAVLAGCGAASGQEGAERPTPNAGLAESALRRLEAPPDFRRASCASFAKLPYSRCYRRKTFAPLNVAMFATLITASGLTPDPGTVICPHFPSRPRSHRRFTWEQCEGSASAASIEFDVSARSIKILRPKVLEPSGRKVLEKLRGTAFRLTVVSTQAAHS